MAKAELPGVVLTYKAPARAAKLVTRKRASREAVAAAR
jgi:hypothetical protein